MQPWHLRKARLLVYVALPLCVAGVLVTCILDAEDFSGALIGMRQLFGLWALGLLLAAMIIGPLSFIAPGIPIRAHLVFARRAIGISAFVFAIAHVLAYLIPVLLRNWRELYASGTSWLIGLIVGVAVFIDMAVLAFTSRDKAVVKLGRKWKRLHATIYVMLPLILIHAVFLGADFGVNRGPDVKSEPDMGALFGFLALTILWLGLFILRRRGVRWNLKKQFN